MFIIVWTEGCHFAAVPALTTAFTDGALPRDGEAVGLRKPLLRRRTAVLSASDFQPATLHRLQGSSDFRCVRSFSAENPRRTSVDSQRRPGWSSRQSFSAFQFHARGASRSSRSDLGEHFSRQRILFLSLDCSLRSLATLAVAVVSAENPRSPVGITGSGLSAVVPGCRTFP